MKYKNIDLSELPFYNVSESAAKSFIDYRKEIKKPLTQRGFDLCLAEAVKCGTLNLSPDEVLDKTQLWGWQAPNFAYTANKLASEFSAISRTLMTKEHRHVLEDRSDTTWAN
jgi:hypothetical protein